MATLDRVSTKLSIPHPAEANCNLVGILEQLSPHEQTQGRKIALILHGTMGHKDYLFQKRLAKRLPLDSFRFDFRGNFESGGVWNQGGLDEDLVDLQTVVDYLRKGYGYIVDVLVGHSRASIVAFKWISTTEDGRRVSAFVNASGRYRMPKILESPSGVHWTEEIAKNGVCVWNVTVARQALSIKITAQDLQRFVEWDNSFVWTQFPPQTDVLSLHGLSDETVPVYDSLIYGKALSNRAPGTHTLHIMEGADHNFTGRQDEVVDVILGWWDRRCRKELDTGISIPSPLSSKL